jgi:hypothetical protein
MIEKEREGTRKRSKTKTEIMMFESLRKQMWTASMRLFSS